MDGAHHSFNFGLHRAAAAGDDDGVRYALRSGADVNALDATGKTGLICAIAGDKYVFFLDTREVLMLIHRFVLPRVSAGKTWIPTTRLS